jgi:hypothetical protein
VCAASRSRSEGSSPTRSSADVLARPLAGRGGSQITTGFAGQLLVFHGVLVARPPDCECVRDQGIAQPVNTLTSAAYGVASLPVWLAARRSTGLLRIELHTYAGALLAVMAGSAQFHARAPGSSHRLHDGSQYAAVSLGSLLLLPTAGTLADTRAGRRFLLAAATAGTAYAGGRSSSRFCRPESPLQLHGLWHVLSAGAAALVAFVSTDGRHEQRAAGSTSRFVTSFHVGARTCGATMVMPLGFTIVHSDPWATAH